MTGELPFDGEAAEISAVDVNDPGVELNGTIELCAVVSFEGSIVNQIVAKS